MSIDERVVEIRERLGSIQIRVSVAVRKIEQENKACQTELVGYVSHRRQARVFLTNKTRDDIAKSFDARIASRLQLFPWIGIGGKDQRSVTP